MKDPDHAASYEDLEIRFVAGKSPVLIIYDKESGEVEETIALDKLKIEEMHELLRSRGFVRRAGDAPSSGDQEGVGRQSVRSDERAAKERRERPSLDDHDKSRVQRERAYAKERRRAREDLSRDRTAGEKKEFRRKAVADHEGEGMEREMPEAEVMIAKRKFDRAKHEARLDGEL
ncbi:unnamed protein product [Ascophyllum nodosum]